MPIFRPFRTAVAFLPLALASPAWAAGSNMPWEQPLQQILESVQGPVARVLVRKIRHLAGRGRALPWASSLAA
jgi:type IV secretory pathway VirB2 component (pilin)